MGGIYELHVAASSAVAPRPGTELRASPPPTLGFPAVAPECPPQRAPHRLPVSASPSHARLPRTLPSPRLPDVQRHLETPSLGDPGRGGRGARGRDPEGLGWGGGAFPPGMASSAGARWGGRTRAVTGCSRAWHRLGGAARAPQTGRRGAGAPSAGDAGGLSPRGVEAGGPGWLPRGSSTARAEGGARAAGGGLPRGDLRAAMRVRVCLRGADAARSGNGACAYGGPGTPSGPRPPSRSSPRSFLGWGPRPCSGRALGTREPRPAGPPARRRGSVSSAPALPAGRRQGVAAAATGARRTREPLTAAAGPVVGAAARGGPPRSTPLGRGSAEDTGRLSQSAFLQGGFRCEGGGQGTAHPLPAGIQAGVVASEDPAARSPEDSRLVGRASLAHRTLPQRVAIPAFISCARVQSNHSEPRCLLHVAELHDAQTPRERAISCDKLSSLHIRLTVSVTFSKGDKPSLKMGR